MPQFDPEQIAVLAATAVGSGGITAVLTQIAAVFREKRREDGIEKRIQHLEDENARCQQANADLREEIGGLREAVRRLERIESGVQPGTKGTKK